MSRHPGLIRLLNALQPRIRSCPVVVIVLFATANVIPWFHIEKNAGLLRIEHNAIIVDHMLVWIKTHRVLKAQSAVTRQKKFDTYPSDE